MIRKVFLKTFGCEMNERDSEIVRGLLESEGYTFVDQDEKADIVIFNTCAVRQHAEHKVVSSLGSLIKKGRKHNHPRIYGLIGCVAQHRKDELFRAQPEINFLCGPSEIYRIPDIIREIIHGRKRMKALSTDRKHRPLNYVNPGYRESKEHASVNISYGCDNFCTYCIVPYVRGKEVSRPAHDIIREIKELVSGGIKQVMLLGQNVNSYSADEKRSDGATVTVDFVTLLTLINDIEGLKKISFMTSHPKDASTRLFKAMRDLEKVNKHLHLPVQSGSDRILKLMNRGYTLAKYEKAAFELRSLIPDVRLTTDIIIGFPTETEEDFELTKKVLEDMRFDLAYIYKYSPREPSKASEMADDVPIETKKKRNQILLDLQRKISKNKKERAC